MIFEETEEELLTLSPEDMLNITQVSNEKKGPYRDHGCFFGIMGDYYGGPNGCLGYYGGL